MTITVKKLLDDPLLGLSVVAGGSDLDRRITTAELNRPSLELTGYLDAFRAERIQVFGNGEVDFIEIHTREERLQRDLRSLFEKDFPCGIITNGRTPPALIDELGSAYGIPILTCPHSTTKLYKRLWENLDSEFAPQTTVHGTLMDIHDVGVLIMGRSSVGKSECALELIRRGFHFVADDLVHIKCLSDTILIGRASNLLPYHMEARGMGIIDISRLFGAAAIRREKRITCVITLAEWNEMHNYDRTGLEEETITILDVQVPHIVIPVRPGRNVGTLVEIASLNQKLKSMGVHSAKIMEERLIEELERKRQSRESPA